MSTSDHALDGREDWDICAPVLTVSKALIRGKGRTIDGARASVASVACCRFVTAQIHYLILSSIFEGSDYKETGSARIRHLLSCSYVSNLLQDQQIRAGTQMTKMWVADPIVKGECTCQKSRIEETEAGNVMSNCKGYSSSAWKCLVTKNVLHV